MCLLPARLTHKHPPLSPAWRGRAVGACQGRSSGLKLIYHRCGCAHTKAESRGLSIYPASPAGFAVTPVSTLLYICCRYVYTNNECRQILQHSRPLLPDMADSPSVTSPGHCCTCITPSPSLERSQDTGGTGAVPLQAMAPWLASYSPVPKASPSSTPPWAWINLSGITAGIGSKRSREQRSRVSATSTTMWICGYLNWAPVYQSTSNCPSDAAFTSSKINPGNGALGEGRAHREVSQIQNQGLHSTPQCSFTIFVSCPVSAPDKSRAELIGTAPPPLGLEEVVEEPCNGSLHGHMGTRGETALEHYNML